MQAQGPPSTKICTYKDWLFAAYGQTFAETFPMEYGLKNHTTSAENITTDWLGPRMYRPSLEEVLRGALSPTTPDVHYITEFRYPSRRGFVSFLNLFLKQTELRVDHELVSLDPKARSLRFANGAESTYDYVISSIPLLPSVSVPTVLVNRSTDDGRTWSAPISPHHDTAQTQHGFGSLFDLPGGGFGLVWLDGRGIDPEADADVHVPSKSRYAERVKAG